MAGFRVCGDTLGRGVLANPYIWQGWYHRARWGLVNQVVAAEALRPAAQALAAQLVQAAPLALAAVKELLRETEGQPLPEAYRSMRSGRYASYHAMLNSEDAREGPRAFADKRAPRWSGR
jgi:crotonobetainyl-CoA hydratase